MKDSAFVCLLFNPISMDKRFEMKLNIERQSMLTHGFSNFYLMKTQFERHTYVITMSCCHDKQIYKMTSGRLNWF